MLERMGIGRPGGGGRPRARRRPAACCPTTSTLDLESLIERMIRLLLIEISAFHAFAWAEEVLSDTDLVAGDGEAARLVSYIRADETPARRVPQDDALRDARPHLRRRRRASRYAGAEMIGRIWDRAVGRLARRRAGSRTSKLALGEVEHALDGHPRRRRPPRPSSTLGLADADGAVGRWRREVRHLLRAPAAPALGRRTASASSSRTRSSRSSWPTSSASTSCGRSSTTSSRSTRTRARPRCSSPPPASAPRTSASATASSRRRPPTTTRPAPPSASPCSTSSRTAGSSSARASRRREAELGGFGIDPVQKREMWLEGLEVAIRCMTEAPFTGVDGKYVLDAAPQRRAQAGAEAAPAAVGGVLAPRHDPARRREGHRRADLRLHRPRGGAALGRRLRARRWPRSACRSARRSTPTSPA